MKILHFWRFSHENRVKLQEKRAAHQTQNENGVATVVRVKIAGEREEGQEENGEEVETKVPLENRRKIEENPSDKRFSKMIQTIAASKMQIKTQNFVNCWKIFL